MDIGGIGLAAAQINAGQRTQQAGVAAIRQQQIQAQTFVSLISEVADAAATEGARAPVPVGATQKSNPLPDQNAPDRRLPRGSLVNILA